MKGDITTASSSSDNSCNPTTSCVDLRLPNGVSSVTAKVAVSRDFSGTLVFEVAPDSVTFAQPSGIAPPIPEGKAGISKSGKWTIPTQGMTDVRVRAASLISGTATVSLVAPNQTVPVSSDWYVYQRDGKDSLKFTGIGSDGNPRIYNKKNVLLVGIDRFGEYKSGSSGEWSYKSGTIVDAYKASVTQGTPQNQTDLAALTSALLGISPGTAAPTGALLEGEEAPPASPPCHVLFLAAGFQPGTAALPFDAKVTVVADDHYSSTPAKASIEGEITTFSGPSCDQTTGCVDLRLPDGVSSVTAKVAVSPDFSGTLVFEVAPDSVAFVQPTGIAPSVAAGAVGISTSGTWTIGTQGKTDVRVRGDSPISGTASVTLQAASMPAAVVSKPPSPGGGAVSQTPTEPAPGVMTCTGNGNSLPCTTTRTFTSNDREWWDVSIGVTIPGVREPKYSIVSSAVKRSVTLHTDLYAMLDLYPFAYAAAKDDWEPHFNLGVPITSQSLYRPYFGMAESIGGLLTRVFRPRRQLGLPVGLNVFAGMTWMKTQIVIGNPTTPNSLTADLHSTHVWKPVYGIEVPISSIASKIKGAGSKNTNGSGKSTGGS